MKQSRSLILLLGALLPAIGMAAEAGSAMEAETASDLFEPMDVFELEWATDPQVAPDGRTIAYVRAGYDVMTDRQVNRIWLIDADGGRHRPLTDRDGTAPVWSPDGKRIAFL
ncbi:MAG: S9 family peptidase, partial [Gammaproteobacteria bacterium]